MSSAHEAASSDTPAARASYFANFMVIVGLKGYVQLEVEHAGTREDHVVDSARELWIKT